MSQSTPPRLPWPQRMAASAGQPVLRVLGHFSSVAWLGWKVLLHSLSLRGSGPRAVILEQTLLQVRFTALQALPLALFMALLLGGITLLQVFGQLGAFGAETLLSRLLAQLVVRELGPLLVGVLVIARSGTAIAAEMASIQLSGEVDALAALGVNPILFLLVPRVVGGMVSVFSLVVLFDTTALLGGFALARLRMPLSLPAYLLALGEAIGGSELAITALKALAFGSLVPLLCASFGLRVKGSQTEIPQAVTRAAVASLAAMLLVSALLSVAIYG